MRASELSRLPLVPAWLSGTGAERDVVIASRARLARNLADEPYPASDAEGGADGSPSRAAGLVVSAVRSELTPDPFDAESLELDARALSGAARQLLAERAICDGSRPERLVITADEGLAIVIGGIDHLRIASVLPGFVVGETLSRVRRVDRQLERGLNYAVSMDWGYLASEITNLGTGLRVSVLVHVPALAALGRLETMGSSMENSGYELTPYFADESLAGAGANAVAEGDAGRESSGSALCLLRNRRTLGSDEDAITSKLEDYATKLVHYERAAREELREARGEEIADSANRALGVLRFARSLSAVEARSLVSHLRFGVVAGLVSDVAVETVTTLLLINQDRHIERYRAGEGERDDTDLVRARVFRDMLVASQA
ncbi:MAG: hypothetical protein ACOCVO_01175 [bacterium]